MDAQDAVMAEVLAELRAGAKRTHWMWFVFPQLAGLGHSATARFYALSGAPEAEAYLAHPVLGARLLECTAIVQAASGRSVHQMFGSPDDLKLHSCLTLFAAVAPGEAVFRDALVRFFDGRDDPGTVALLGR